MKAAVLFMGICVPAASRSPQAYHFKTTPFTHTHTCCPVRCAMSLLLEPSGSKSRSKVTQHPPQAKAGN